MNIKQLVVVAIIIGAGNIVAMDAPPPYPFLSNKSDYNIDFGSIANVVKKEEVVGDKLMTGYTAFNNNGQIIAGASRLVNPQTNTTLFMGNDASAQFWGNSARNIFFNLEHSYNEKNTQ